MSRHLDWLRQAENDLEWARYSFAGEFYAQTCFVSQQAAEKALKAFAFSRGFDVVKTHSLVRIIRDLREDGDLERHARELDLYYVSGRYPDAFPAGAPFEVLGPEQARRALSAAEEVVRVVSERIGKG
jgi:HEPN domain-containing protein